MELSLAEREVSFDLIFETKRKPFCNVQVKQALWDLKKANQSIINKIVYEQSRL